MQGKSEAEALSSEARELFGRLAELVELDRGQQVIVADFMDGVLDEAWARDKRIPATALGRFDRGDGRPLTPGRPEARALLADLSLHLSMSVEGQTQLVAEYEDGVLLRIDRAFGWQRADEHRAEEPDAA